MRITVDIKGFYDWVPCPSGTEILQEDVSALRVKKMADEKWYMKVSVPSSDPAQTHDVGIHEEMIIRTLAAREKNGRETYRDECVADMLRESFRHHLHPSHLVKIHVTDEGPNEQLYREALTALSVPNMDDAVSRYMEESDLEDYLNKVFKTESTKEASKKPSKKAKEK